MSRPGEPTGRTQRPHPGAGFEPPSGRFQSALVLDANKPDSKVSALDLGSPVSPLQPRAASAAVTNTSSSSSSSGSVTGKTRASAAAARNLASGGAPGRRNHSGELSGESSPTAFDGRGSRPGHRRTGSGPLIYSGSGGSSSASSPVTNVLPAGNICPSGIIGKTGMIAQKTPRSDVLGSGTGNYGHGSIMRGGAAGAVSGKVGGDAGMGNLGDSAARRAMASSDLQEVTRVANEQYKREQFAEALRLYDRAIAMCQHNAAYRSSLASCRSNRAAALMGLGRLGEAVKECEEVVRLDPVNDRAHQRLASLYLRLGQVDNAKRHIYIGGQQPHPLELQKLQALERHLGKCIDARKIGDWKSALREADAAIAAGADSSPLLIASRAEALLHLHQLDEADSALSSAPKFDISFSSSLQTKFFGMLSDSYIYIVRAQVDMALGRFENAVAMAEKARQIDPTNTDVTAMLNSVRSVSRARAQGNEFFKSGYFAEACMAYGEGLKYDPSNSVLHCNRAACRSKLGQWEKAVEDCNEALRIHPSYTKALLRRAASYVKLERWAEAVRDYEALRKELPSDTEVAEALFHAQVALKTSRGEEVSNMKFGGEVEEITSMEQFQAAISLSGASVVYFMAPSNQQCTQMSPFVDALCTQNPSANFLKVNVNESPAIAKAENVRIVPTFKIYKDGMKMKEMICPSQKVLEVSVRHYSILH
ncbi:TPR repeat-containing thioredoxin TTL1 [Cocos nucifera]|uniref:TPR repeat-containing thioredoxin TTL1 n=1 Tax=Cocos nucifera TaxID=13894 RepID=A0A8K0I9Z7_COCNU|nr:TPR repeat-containing thioredoxin TTL1 [Cocos nucifera]